MLKLCMELEMLLDGIGYLTMIISREVVMVAV